MINRFARSLVPTVLLLFLIAARADAQCILSPFITIFGATEVTVSNGPVTTAGGCEPCRTPLYEYCLKPSSSVFTAACNVSSVQTNDPSYTFTGLTPNTSYKIKKFGWFKTDAFIGGGCRRRHLYTWHAVRVPPPVPPTVEFSISTATMDSITVQIDHSAPGTVDSLRVCHKEKGKWIVLSSVCQNAVPFSPAQGPLQGYHDFASPQLSNTFVFDQLKTCEDFTFRAYTETGGAYTAIGDKLFAQTAGACSQPTNQSHFLIGELETGDYPILDAYTANLDATVGVHYGALDYVDYLVSLDYIVALEVANIEAEEEPIDAQDVLWEYVMGEQEDLLLATMSDPVIVASRADIQSYLEDNDPTLLATLLASGSAPAPIGHWKLEETSGSTAADSAGSNDGTISGATLGQTGQIDGAFLFDGSDDHIDLGAKFDGEFITVSAWVNADFPYTLLNFPTIAGAADDFANRGWNLYYVGTSDRWGFFNVASGSATSPVITSDAALGRGVWQHIVGVGDGSSSSLYIDGVLVGSDTGTGTYTASNGNVRIGDNNEFVTSTPFFPGLIDDVCIFDTALAAPQVGQLYSNGLAGIPCEVAAPGVPSMGGAGLALIGIAAAAIGTIAVRRSRR